MVEVQKLEAVCDSCGASATLCGDRCGRETLKVLIFVAFLGCADEPSCGRGAKTPRFFAISDLPARPSARIGVVEVQKLVFFVAFLRCADESAWSRYKNSRLFLAMSDLPRDPLRASAWSRCKKSSCFSLFCGARMNPSRGRGAKPLFFAISDLPARPSARIGVVEVQKLVLFFWGGFLWCADEPSAGISVVKVQKHEVFCDF